MTPWRARSITCEFDGVETVLCPEGRYCAAPVTHKATLGRIVELLHTFHEQPRTLVMPEIARGSLEKKLYSMYLSYLPKEKAAFPLKMNVDDRGQLYGTAENRKMRPVFRQHQQAGNHQRTALAQQQVGILYGGGRPRLDSGAENRDR